LVRDENLLGWPRSPEKVRSLLSDYYALVSHLDRSVGEIVKALKDNGLYDNTIIVYAADNGLAAGSHGLLGKQNLYEHSMKVPLIISGPGIPQKSETDALVYLFDIYPTLAELCGISLSEGTDGKSLLGIIINENEEVRSSLFTAYRKTVRAVRTDEWKLIKYPERNYSQLFNLKTDPLELNNLANDSDFAGKLNEMTELMKKWQSDVDDKAPLSVENPLPLEYDHTLLRRKPDQWQPEYTLNKYFQNN